MNYRIREITLYENFMRNKNWCAHLIDGENEDSLIRIETDNGFEECLQMARDFIAFGPTWEVTSVYPNGSGAKCNIRAVGIDRLAESVDGATHEEALANGRAECARRNAESIAKRKAALK